MKELIGIVLVILGAIVSVISSIAGTGKELSIAANVGIGVGECIGIAFVIAGPILIILGIRDKDKSTISK